VALTLHHADDFNRADATLAGATMSDGVGAWTVRKGTWDVASNVAAQTGGADALIYDSAMNVATTDQAAQVKSVSHTCGPICRATTYSTDDMEFYLAYRDSGDGVSIYKKVAGSYTLISGPAGTCATNDLLKIEAIGTTITAYVNGSSVTSGSDSARTAGHAGISGNTGTNTTRDDFTDYIDAGGGGTTRGAPLGSRGTAFNGGRTFMGILR